ncbi:hypothetical protein VTJ04DRAFT_5465 [Mycothermus thermophilus]|uniref:uncharacterized protein n=1 Tax=Humicola insolens TaxID=85995 RepID=UPI003742F3F0
MEWQLVLVFMVWRDEDWKEYWYLWYGKRGIGGGISYVCCSYYFLGVVMEGKKGLLKAFICSYLSEHYGRQSTGTSTQHKG